MGIRDTDFKISILSIFIIIIIIFTIKFILVYLERFGLLYRLREPGPAASTAVTLEQQIPL